MQELFERLGVFYSEAQVAEVARELEEAASLIQCASEVISSCRPWMKMGVPLTPAQEKAMARQLAVRRVGGNPQPIHPADA